MKRAIGAAALVLPLLLTGCGGDDAGGSDGTRATDDTSSSTTADATPSETGAETGTTGTTEAGGTGPITDDDRAAIESTLVDFFLEPRCDLATGDYLVELSILGAEKPDEACDQWTEYWVEPAYDADDVVVSDITGSDGVATAEVGSEYVNITTVYELTQVDGKWLVSCDEITCDHL